MTAQIRASIEALNAEFAHILDTGDYDRLDTVFTEDASYTSGGSTLKGVAEIRARFTGRRDARTTRHTCSGLRLTVQAPTVVEASSVWVCYAANQAAPVPSTGVYMVADFHDRYELDTAGVWRIASREISGVFREPSLAPPAAPAGDPTTA